MNRRAFLSLGAAIASTTWRTQAQSPPRRLAALLTVDNVASRSSLSIFEERLAQLGWTVDRAIRIDPYWGGVAGDQYRRHVTELVKTNPDVILSSGTIGLEALVSQKVRSIPIVFVQVTDPVAAGFVKTLSRPGANITGFTNFGSNVGADRVRMLKEIAPGLKRVMLLHDAAYPTPPGLIGSTESEARARGLEYVDGGVRGEHDLDSTVDAFAKTPNGGLVVLSDPLTAASSARIATVARRHRLPAIYALASFADAGGLISYGVDIPRMWRDAASYVDRILRGARPDDLPVQEPSDPEIVVNVPAADAIGLRLPAPILNRARRVIR